MIPLSFLSRVLPPRVSVPLRSRFGNSREPELTLLPSFVKAGDVVVDVGAHKGSYTYRLARLVGPNGRVIAYEPQPGLAAYLTAAMGTSTMRCVELRCRALSDSAGSATLSTPIEEDVAVVGRATLRSVEGRNVGIVVDVAVLDDEPFPGPVTFMKIDVEGHELALLRGARGMLAEHKPTLLVEVEYRHAAEAIEDLAELLLNELGYIASEMSVTGGLTPVPRELWQQGAALNNRADGRYVNNFVFHS